MKRIYLDYAALTPVDPRVTREMKRCSSADYGNPSSLYREGVNAKRIVEQARAGVAAFMHAHADEIVFTSGGTEANGLALEGSGRAARHSGVSAPHLVISAIEHSSIRETAHMLEAHGVEVTRLSVDAAGCISLDELKKAIRPDTYLVSVMAVNNEIGTLHSLRDIAKVVRDARKQRNTRYPLFHTDAAQALYEEIDMEKNGVDLLTLDGSKAYGPRGMGCLYVRRGTPIEPIIHGGGQERGMRSGTENLPAIAGFARALAILRDTRAGKRKEHERLSALKDYFIREALSLRPDIRVNGGTEGISPHIVNLSIPGIDNEFFVFQLDARGIACSTKSSCLRDEDESFVLKAIGAESASSVRFSFGRWTTRGDLRKTLGIMKELLQRPK